MADDTDRKRNGWFSTLVKALGWDGTRLPNSTDIRRVTTTYAIIAIVGVALVAAHAYPSKRAASWLLASGAFFMAGVTFGFLFGIPRALMKEVNSNLELISDWLTKILVGVGLTQLNQIPSGLVYLSRFVAGGDKSPCDDQSFALFVILYFFLGGFVGGYLVTRVYITGAFMRVEQCYLLQGHKAQPAELAGPGGRRPDNG